MLLLGLARTLPPALLAVVAAVLLFPRPNAVVQPVDVAMQAARARPALAFTPVVPQNLPPGWVPTVAREQTDSTHLRSWHVTYQTPSGRYAGVVETVQATAPWMDSMASWGSPVRVVTVAGQPWLVVTRPVRGVTALVLNPPLPAHPAARLTVLVAGTTDQAELEQLIQSLPLPAGLGEPIGSYPGLPATS